MTTPRRVPFRSLESRPTSMASRWLKSLPQVSLAFQRPAASRPHPTRPLPGRCPAPPPWHLPLAVPAPTSGRPQKGIALAIDLARLPHGSPQAPLLALLFGVELHGFRGLGSQRLGTSGGPSTASSWRNRAAAAVQGSPRRRKCQRALPRWPTPTLLAAMKCRNGLEGSLRALQSDSLEPRRAQ